MGGCAGTAPEIERVRDVPPRMLEDWPAGRLLQSPTRCEDDIVVAYHVASDPDGGPVGTGH